MKQFARFESNQSGIETCKHHAAERACALFESNQSGIETVIGCDIKKTVDRLNRTKVELKRYRLLVL